MKNSMEPFGLDILFEEHLLSTKIKEDIALHLKVIIPIKKDFLTDYPLQRFISKFINNLLAKEVI